MLEPEIAFGNLDDVISLSCGLFKHIFTNVLNNCEEEVNYCVKTINQNVKTRLENDIKNDFNVITYDEAFKLLEDKTDHFTYPLIYKEGLNTEHEKYLSEKLIKGPVYVTNYPKEIKPFYMRENEDGKTVSCVDCLFPQLGELIGGSEREADYDILKEKMTKLKLIDESLDVSNKLNWYLNLRKYGSVPHSGFGLGFERLVQYITGIDNIRDVTPVVRVQGNCKF